MLVGVVTASHTVFSTADLAELARRGITPADAAAQVALLRTPPAEIVLDRPCTVGDGIMVLEEGDRQRLADRGAALAAAGRVSTFVPASGAATRMFRDLIGALQAPARPSSQLAGEQLFDRLDAFPFAAEVRRRAGVAGSPASEADERALLETLLEGMRYAQLPKALIPFHWAADGPRTAFEDHLIEAARYARAADGTCRLHFTVAPAFREEFARVLGEIRPRVEQRCGCRPDVTFAEQSPATDTLALDAAGEPFRGPDGSLLFRPGGHGALIRNLEALGGDLVVIKNIDNVRPAEVSDEVVRWKQVSIGYLGDVQAEVLEALSGCLVVAPTDEALRHALSVAAKRFARRPAGALPAREDKRRFAVDALDRPLRVCGMVRNEGEPGGAPFWVREADGTTTVQIVEASQVAASNPQQRRVFEASTHFNPVDLVCGLRSWTGEPFDLRRFVDERAVFLSSKSHEGRELRALERPGLWNGAMAGWNTICVEVPASTFAPVKTVFDLLRPQHQTRGGA